MENVKGLNSVIVLYIQIIKRAKNEYYGCCGNESLIDVYVRSLRSLRETNLQ
jgi:hypothetical protein